MWEAAERAIVRNWINFVAVFALLWLTILGIDAYYSRHAAVISEQNNAILRDRVERFERIEDRLTRIERALGEGK